MYVQVLKEINQKRQAENTFSSFRFINIHKNSNKQRFLKNSINLNVPSALQKHKLPLREV